MDRIYWARQDCMSGETGCKIKGLRQRFRHLTCLSIIPINLKFHPFSDQCWRIHTVNGLIFMGYQFSWRVQTMNFSTHEIAIFCMNYKGKNIMSTNFDPNECINLDQSTKLVPTKNITTQSVASPSTPYYSMMPIVTFTFDLQNQ